MGRPMIPSPTKPILSGIHLLRTDRQYSILGVHDDIRENGDPPDEHAVRNRHPRLRPERSVVCATEDHGPAVRIPPPWRSAHPFLPVRAGCMSLLPDPERSGEMYAVMGCFVGYKFQGGGIYWTRAAEDGESTAVRVLDLPFAHRIGIARRGAARYLFAANLADDKKDAADWSRAGGVYAARLDGNADTPLELRPVLTGLHRNHGFLLTTLEGSPALLVGAAEGLIAIDLASTNREWQSRTVLARETSEMAVFDVDGDGRDELITIEPFHGNTLRAYRHEGKAWAPFWEAELEYGHCVLAGMFDGRRTVIVSSRSGSRSLLFFRFGDDAARPERVVVDEGAGAANMLVLGHAGRDRLFAANQAAGEIAMYTGASSA